MSDTISKAIELLQIASCPCCDGAGAYYDNHGCAWECQFCCERKQAIEALQALQSGEPIAAVRGYYNGRCIIKPLDPALVLPVGMALYAAPQPVVPEGYITPFAWMRPEDAARTMIAVEGERAEVAPDKEHGFSVPLYRCQQPAVDRNELIELLIATRTQSEGVTADLIIKLLSAGAVATPQPVVPERLAKYVAKKKAELDRYIDEFCRSEPGTNAAVWNSGYHRQHAEDLQEIIDELDALLSAGKGGEQP
jgi:hypothetical protein